MADHLSVGLRCYVRPWTQLTTAYRGAIPRVSPMRYLALVVVLVVGVGAVAVVGATPPLAPLDDDTALTTSAAKAQFHETGNVSVDLTQVNATLTLAEDHEHVGLDGPRLDADKALYLRVDYNEGIARRIRFWVPATYVEPQLQKGMDPVGEGPEITLEPIRNRSYMQATLTVEGETDAVYALPVENSAVFSVRAWVRDKVERGTGFQIPQLADPGVWRFVNATEWNNGTAMVPPRAETLQYRDETSWLLVPDCDGDTTEVCRYQTPNATVLVAAEGDPPPVRYRRDAAPLADFRSAVAELRQIPERIANTIGSLTGEQ